MSKRPSIDLLALTAEQASPMPEAVQRTPVPAAGTARQAEPVTPNLESLGFKVSHEFRRRFRQRAANADLKLNELLFEALDAWEQARGLKQ